MLNVCHRIASDCVVLDLNAGMGGRGEYGDGDGDGDCTYVRTYEVKGVWDGVV